MRRAAYLLIALLILVPIAAAVLGHFIGAGVLHPMNLNPDRVEQTARMLAVTGATKEDFGVRAPDGVQLRGWKVRPAAPKGDWVLLFHDVSDNRLSRASKLLSPKIHSPICSKSATTARDCISARCLG